MKRTKLRRYYFEALAYKGDTSLVTRHTRKEKLEQVHITESSELRAKRCVLEQAWAAGLFVLEINLTKSKNVT